MTSPATRRNPPANSVNGRCNALPVNASTLPSPVPELPEVASVPSTVAPAVVVVVEQSAGVVVVVVVDEPSPVVVVVVEPSPVVVVVVVQSTGAVVVVEPSPVVVVVVEPFPVVVVLVELDDVEVLLVVEVLEVVVAAVEKVRWARAPDVRSFGSSATRMACTRAGRHTGTGRSGHPRRRR